MMKMHIKVHDEREPPIGWTVWDPKPGSADAGCDRNCVTGIPLIRRTRHCRCFNGTDIHIDDDRDRMVNGVLTQPNTD